MLGKTRIVPDELDPATRHAVNKRLTLNILIQGAATHAFLDINRFARKDLDLLDKRFVPYYDTMSLGMNLSYWRGLLVLVAGRPKKFWNSLHRPGNVFYRHRFLRRHGRQLATNARKLALQSCQQKGVPTSAMQNEACMFHLFHRLAVLEQSHCQILEGLARHVCSEIFDIETSKLNASLTFYPKFGTVRKPETFRGKIMLQAMGAWSGVERCGDELVVVAKAIFWPMLIHELIKGTMELICLHGLNDLPESQFATVMDHTEHLEYEIPMIQIGPEIYRRFLQVLPRETSLAECVMKVSMLDPIYLEEFMFDMIESPNRATDMLRTL